MRYIVFKLVAMATSMIGYWLWAAMRAWLTCAVAASGFPGFGIQFSVAIKTFSGNWFANILEEFSKEPKLKLKPF